MDQYKIIKDELLLMHLRFGMPPYIFWENYKDFIQNRIEKFNLEPLDITVDVAKSSVPERSSRNIAFEENRALTLKPIDFPGGIRNPHFHFDGKIYLLNERQWKDFSKDIIKSFQEKLAKVGSVNFEKIMRLSNAIDTL